MLVCFIWKLYQSEPIHAAPIVIVKSRRRIKASDLHKEKYLVDPKDIELAKVEKAKAEKEMVTTSVVEVTENSEGEDGRGKKFWKNMVGKKKGDSAGTLEKSKVEGRPRAQSDPTSDRRGYRAVKDAARDGLSKIVRPEIPKMEDILKGKKIPTPHIPRALQPPRKRGSSVSTQ